VTVVFYYLKQYQQGGKLRLACNLVNTAYKKGRVVYLCTENDEQSERLDEMLWSFASNSFIPHIRYAQNQQVNTEKYPVSIGCVQPSQRFNDVLVSIRQDVPEFFSQFGRIMEPVTAGQKDKENAKLKFEKYQLITGTKPTIHYIE